MRLMAARTRRPVRRRAHAHTDQVAAWDPGAPLTAGGLMGIQQRAGNRAASVLVAQRQAAASAALQPMVRWGSRGPAVTVLQDHLVQAGARITVDGAFGPMTHGAVLAFQRAAGLVADGIVGPQTWSALKAGSGRIGDPAGGQAGGPAGSDETGRVVARLRSITVLLGALGSGGQVGGGAALGAGGAPVQRSALGFAPLSGGETAAPPSPDLAAAAGQVLVALGQVPPGALAQLGGAADTLQTVAVELSGGGPAAQDLRAALGHLNTVAADLAQLSANTAGASAGSTDVDVKEKTYAVNGTDSASIGQELDVRQSTHGEAGHVGPLNNQGPLLTNVHLTANGLISKADVVVKLERVLPKLANPGKVCATQKAEYDRFHGALVAHEQEHVNKFKAGYAGAHLAMLGKTEAAAATHLDTITGNIDTAQATFDTTTDNGRTPPPGTTFNAGIGC
jgi:peptidoglycan hydrolase-like protein with peptidoglycan-binding domain